MSHIWLMRVLHLPLTQEIRHQISESRDPSLFLIVFWLTGTLFTHVEFFWEFGDSRENVFDIYGEWSENLLEILAVVIIVSPISCVCGGLWEYRHVSRTCDSYASPYSYYWMSHVTHVTYESCHTDDARHWRYSYERCVVLVLQCSAWCCSVPRYPYEHRVVALQCFSVAVFRMVLQCSTLLVWASRCSVAGVQCCSAPHMLQCSALLVWASRYPPKKMAGLRPHIHPFVWFVP